MLGEIGRKMVTVCECLVSQMKATLLTFFKLGKSYAFIKKVNTKEYKMKLLFSITNTPHHRKLLLTVTGVTFQISFMHVQVSIKSTLIKKKCEFCITKFCITKQNVN